MSDKPEDISQWIWDLAGELIRIAIPETAQEDVARALLHARSKAFEECAKLIEEGFDKEAAKPYRSDGVPSKNDECPHGKYMYEDCEACISQAIRQHSYKGRDTE